ncbi:uncharacterized protein C8orf90 homolog [Pantherophis guttatus]|uniref:Uncharacterized protein C8orf90 homolog n=1 Tax=Pantherophis guttatus TaxID=94885 RepID=A0A6P9CA82_PANGU|nr:uncharacterized protein C8orf90 homolog [Pantherophis guttatus]
MASLGTETLDSPSYPPGDGGISGPLASLQQGKPLPTTGSGSKSGGELGSSSQDFLLPPTVSSLQPPPVFNPTASPSTPTGVIYSLSGCPAGPTLSRLFQTLPGSFPDIYDGDMKKWEEHFHSIQRAYKEFGKEDDFAIRVLTEDFTLPFPFAWPGENEGSRQLAYDPADCSGFDFFLHPGQPIPRLLQPLHATTQAFFKKRRLEQLALSYASKASLPGAAGLPTPQETSSPLRPDIMVITSVPCMAAPAEPSFLLQDNKPAPIGLPNSTSMQPISLQFMNPTQHGAF